MFSIWGCFRTTLPHLRGSLLAGVQRCWAPASAGPAKIQQLLHTRTDDPQKIMRIQRLTKSANNPIFTMSIPQLQKQKNLPKNKHTTRRSPYCRSSQCTNWNPDGHKIIRNKETRNCPEGRCAKTGQWPALSFKQARLVTQQYPSTRYMLDRMCPFPGGCHSNLKSLFLKMNPCALPDEGGFSLPSEGVWI